MTEKEILDSFRKNNEEIHGFVLNIFDLIIRIGRLSTSEITGEIRNLGFDRFESNIKILSGDKNLIVRNLRKIFRYTWDMPQILVKGFDIMIIFSIYDYLDYKKFMEMDDRALSLKLN